MNYWNKNITASVLCADTYWVWWRNYSNRAIKPSSKNIKAQILRAYREDFVIGFRHQPQLTYQRVALQASWYSARLVETQQLPPATANASRFSLQYSVPHLFLPICPPSAFHLRGGCTVQGTVQVESWHSVDTLPSLYCTSTPHSFFFRFTAW